jgi:hypothetical protein
MDGILYILVGGGVVAAMASTFITRQGAQPIGEADVAAVVALIAYLAIGAFILTRTRWGRGLHRRLKKRMTMRDEKVRANARDKSQVRKPPWWNVE